VIPVVVVVMMMPVPAMPEYSSECRIRAVVRVILPVIVGPGMLISRVPVNSKVVAFDSVGAKANSDAAASPRWIEKAAYDGF
jgi:hypothetical protein